MKSFALILVLLGMSLTWAQQSRYLAQPSIQVTVNGRTFNCSGDLSDMNCYRAAETGKSKYTACREAGFGGTSCFQNSFATKIPNCSNWSDICNASCKHAGYSSSSCYQNCY